MNDHVLGEFETLLAGIQAISVYSPTCPLQPGWGKPSRIRVRIHLASWRGVSPVLTHSSTTLSMQLQPAIQRPLCPRIDVEGNVSPLDGCHRGLICPRLELAYDNYGPILDWVNSKACVHTPSLAFDVNYRGLLVWLHSEINRHIMAVLRLMVSVSGAASRYRTCAIHVLSNSPSIIQIYPVFRLMP